jgi:hypothetical protein
MNTNNSSQGLTKIKNVLDKRIMEVEAELNNSDTLFKREKLILKRHILQILKTRTSNNLKLLQKLEIEFLKDVEDLTESLIDTFRFDPEEFDLD